MQKKKKNAYLHTLYFLKKSKNLKFSFLFTFLLKKKSHVYAANFYFFYFNALYFSLFKKILEIITIYGAEILVLFDGYSNSLARLNDLNFFFNKKNYIYFKLIKLDKKTTYYIMSPASTQFIFLFIKNLRLNYLNKSFKGLENTCGLVDATTTPRLFNYVLPIVFDFNFSIFFYKFYIFNACAT